MRTVSRLAVAALLAAMPLTLSGCFFGGAEEEDTAEISSDAPEEDGDSNENGNSNANANSNSAKTTSIRTASKADEGVSAAGDTSGQQSPEIGEAEDFEEDDELLSSTGRPVDGLAHEYAGWYMITIPQGYAVTDGESYFESIVDGYEGSISVDVSLFDEETPDLASWIALMAAPSAEGDVTYQTQLVEADLGNYHWLVLARTAPDGWGEVTYYADLLDGSFVQITVTGVVLGDPGANAVVASFSVLPGSAYGNWSAWQDSRMPDVNAGDNDEGGEDFDAFVDDGTEEQWDGDVGYEYEEYDEGDGEFDYED